MVYKIMIFISTYPSFQEFLMFLTFISAPIQLIKQNYFILISINDLEFIQI